jgi:phosphatidylinositol alpha-1,6-mannosyltransferase
MALEMPVTETRKKILLVTRNFPPQVGGMERLIHHAFLELAREFSLALVGPEGSEDFAGAAQEMLACPLSPVPRFLWHCQIKSLQLARRFRPDLVLAGSGATAPAAILAARYCGAPAACYLHGLDLVVPGLLYKSIFLPAIRRCQHLLVNSHHTGALAGRAGIASERIRILHPGVSLLDGKTDPADFRAYADIDSRSHILLAVGRLIPRKGLAEFVESVLPRIVARNPEVVLVVIGVEPEHALRHRSGERQRIERAAAKRGLSYHLRLLGAVDDVRLNQAYAAARLLVFPVRDVPGDVEGFGMVALEAAAHGLPTVAFSLGGVTDAIRHGVSGYLIAPGDEEGFARTVLMHLSGEDPALWHGRCREFAADFAWPRFGDRLRQICREAIVARRAP